MATLYHVPTSRSLRVLWTLEEIGATVEVKSLGVRPRLQEPEYLAINPAGTLPALIDGDRAIYESLAICEYLAARHGSDLIVAPGEPERPEFVQWLLYGEATLQAPLSAMARVGRIRNKTPEMQAGINAVLSDARHSLSMRAKLLEQRLEGRDFLVAGRMTPQTFRSAIRSITWESPTSPRCSVPAPRPIVSACLRGQRSSAPRPFPSRGWAVNS